VLHYQKKYFGDAMMRTIFSFILLVTVSLLSYAGDNPTYEFLRQDVSARSSAMAGSFVSIMDDPVGVFYNPATIGAITDPVASFGYTNHLMDINAGYAAYAFQEENLGVFGVGVNYINYGSFDETDELANTTGTFSAGDVAFSVSYAQLYDENLYYGVTGKFIYSSIADLNSSAIAGDIGIVYLIPTSNPITLGAAITNIGTQIDEYYGTREPLPLDFTIGGTIKPQHLPLKLSLNFHRLTEEQSSFAKHFNAFTVGGELTLSKALTFRFGYNNEQRKELKIGTTTGAAGFSLGGGLTLKKMRIDYSFNSLGTIGSINRISIALDM
jgi:hypothetical protein